MEPLMKKRRPPQRVTYSVCISRARFYAHYFTLGRGLSTSARAHHSTLAPHVMHFGLLELVESSATPANLIYRRAFVCARLATIKRGLQRGAQSGAKRTLDHLIRDLSGRTRRAARLEPALWLFCTRHPSV